MKLILYSALSGLAAAPVLSCDLCKVSLPGAGGGLPSQGVFAGISEQYTRYNTLQEEGEEIADPFDQHLNSFITQGLVGYQFHPRAGLQFTMPYIHRDFRRAHHDGEIEEDDETGIGDASLIAQVVAWHHQTEHSSFQWAILGGVKFPTGDSDRLAEETEEHQGEEEEEPSLTGVHGHDLALGSGSWDGIVGTSLWAAYRRVFVEGSMQYSIRTEGDFDYRYANDLLWSGGPGFMLIQSESWALGLQGVVSGEWKGEDEIDGHELDDTAFTGVYVGPQLRLFGPSGLHVAVRGDLPVYLDNSGVMTVPDYRVRAELVLGF